MMTGATINTVIEVEHLSHFYGLRQALDDLSFTVQRGEVLGLLGPNGAGKTTTVRLLNGLFPPTGGRMRVLGLDPTRQGDQVRAQSGVLTETPALYERLTARQNLEFFGTLAEIPPVLLQQRIQELLAFFDLENRSAERVGAYSKGMKQRLALARALLHQPPLLFLDEPTAGLDPEAAQQVHELIGSIRQHNGQTVILCTHNLYEAQRLCDRLAVLSRGRLLAFGSLAELRRQHMPGLWLEVALWQPPAAAILERARYELLALGGVEQLDLPDPQTWRVLVDDQAAIPQVVAWLVQAGAQVLSVQPRQVTLEEIYFSLQEKAGDS